MIFRRKSQKWWICILPKPVISWVLEGSLSSQYGDVDKEIMAFGEKKRVSALLEDYLGYRHDSFGVVAFVLVAFPTVVASFCILNEQTQFPKEIVSVSVIMAVHYAYKQLESILTRMLIMA